MLRETSLKPRGASLEETCVLQTAYTNPEKSVRK